MEVFEEIKAQIKKNPALGIALAVVFIGLVVYLHNRTAAANAAAAPASPAAPTGYGSAGGGGYTLVENIHQMPGPSLPAPAPVPTPAPPPGIGKHYIGPNPWLTPPPPSVIPSSWNPYQYSSVLSANQWPRPKWYNSWWGAGHTSPPPDAR